MREPDVCVPAQYQSDRVIQAGDILITEISANFWGYGGQCLRPYAIGAEPTAEFRALGARLHPSPRIEWVNDHLPRLPHLSRRGDRFDVVMVTAVWIHLDPEQRREAMATVVTLLRAGGLLALNLRHGPTPPGGRRPAALPT